MLVRFQLRAPVNRREFSPFLDKISLEVFYKFLFCVLMIKIAVIHFTSRRHPRV